MKTFFYLTCGGLFLLAILWLKQAPDARLNTSRYGRTTLVDTAKISPDKMAALHQLFQTIEKNLDWQSLEGKSLEEEKVEVLFTIGKNGQLEKLDFVDAPRILQRAIIEALEVLEKENRLLLPLGRSHREILFLQLQFDLPNSKVYSRTLD